MWTLPTQHLLTVVDAYIYSILIHRHDSIQSIYCVCVSGHPRAPVATLLGESGPYTSMAVTGDLSCRNSGGLVLNILHLIGDGYSMLMWGYV